MATNRIKFKFIKPIYVIIPVIRRVMPNIIVNDIISVQPMSDEIVKDLKENEKG